VRRLQTLWIPCSNSVLDDLTWYYHVTCAAAFTSMLPPLKRPCELFHQSRFTSRHSKKPTANTRDEHDEEGHNSKTHAYSKDPCRLTLVQIEYVGCEIDFLVRETHEESALDIDVGLIGPRSLPHQSKSKPIHR